MRSVFLGLIIFVLAAGIASGENKEKTSKPSEGFKKEKVVKLRDGLYTKMYLNTFYKATSLELDRNQRLELNRVGRKYARLIMKFENQSLVLRRKFMEQLDSTPFDSSKLKLLAVEIMDENKETIDNFIAGMTVIQEVIGPENFAKLTPVSKFDRKSRVQLKQGNADHLLEDKDLKSGEPQREVGNK